MNINDNTNNTSTTMNIHIIPNDILRVIFAFTDLQPLLSLVCTRWRGLLSSRTNWSYVESAYVMRDVAKTIVMMNRDSARRLGLMTPEFVAAVQYMLDECTKPILCRFALKCDNIGVVKWLYEAGYIFGWQIVHKTSHAIRCHEFLHSVGLYLNIFMPDHKVTPEIIRFYHNIGAYGDTITMLFHILLCDGADDLLDIALGKYYGLFRVGGAEFKKKSRDFLDKIAAEFSFGDMLIYCCCSNDAEYLRYYLTKNPIHDYIPRLPLPTANNLYPIFEEFGMRPSFYVWKLTKENIPHSFQWQNPVFMMNLSLKTNQELSYIEHWLKQAFLENRVGEHLATRNVQALEWLYKRHPCEFLQKSILISTDDQAVFDKYADASPGVREYVVKECLCIGKMHMVNKHGWKIPFVGLSSIKRLVDTKRVIELQKYHGDISSAVGTMIDRGNVEQAIYVAKRFNIKITDAMVASIVWRDKHKRVAEINRQLEES